MSSEIVVIVKYNTDRMTSISSFRNGMLRMLLLTGANELNSVSVMWKLMAHGIWTIVSLREEGKALQVHKQATY